MSSTSGIRRMARLVTVAAVLVVAGCTPIYQNHGYVPTEEELSRIEVGKSSREEVSAVIGRPSSVGVLQGSGWFYVGSRWKHYGARAPQEIDRQVVAITFNEGGTVENVERFGLERGEVVVLSRRVTKSNIKGLGLIRELLGSFGRVSAGKLLGD
ncbi:outer membrane protein assembly factor BamE [Rhodobacter capsulatus]|uniref:outer membrane protein assembly factor BamE n=1 Tax=Rhodobacter capsulatus TaxID=1061 RepID=UPI00402A21EE